MDLNFDALSYELQKDTDGSNTSTAELNDMGDLLDLNTIPVLTSDTNNKSISRPNIPLDILIPDKATRETKKPHISRVKDPITRKEDDSINLFEFVDSSETPTEAGPRMPDLEYSQEDKCGEGDFEGIEPEAAEPEAAEPEAKELEAKEPEAKKPEAKKPEDLSSSTSKRITDKIVELSLKKQDPESSIFSFIVPYCDIDQLLSLANTCKAARKLATADSIWEPICTKARFVQKNEDEGSLLSLTTAVNVIDTGFISGDLSYFRTFCRAFHLLHNTLTDPMEAAESLDYFEKAQLLGNAQLLETAINYRREIIGDSPSVSNELIRTITAAKEELLNEIASLIEKHCPVPPRLLFAIDIWSVKTDDIELKNRTIETYLSQFSVPLDVDEAFIYTADSDTRTMQVSQRKIEAAFSQVASSLIQIMSQVNNADSPVPQSWRSATWSYSLSKFMAAVITYLHDILEKTTKESSELEYLLAVPRLYIASRILSTNSVLIENGKDAEFDVSTYVDSIIMKPIIEEFCERQATYVQRYARKKVDSWNESVSQRENETEKFLWSSVPKKADKTNFISSFKWAFISADAEDDSRTDSKSNSRSASGGNFVDDTLAPATEFEAQTAVLVSKLRSMESLVSIELTIDVLETCRAAFHRLKALGRANSRYCEPLFCLYLDIIGRGHIQIAFEKAIKVLNSYDPKRYGRLLISVGDRSNELIKDRTSENFNNSNDHESNNDIFTKPTEATTTTNSNAVEPLAVFTELVNVGDLVQQMIHVFFEEELVGGHIVRKSDFGAPSVNAKRRFEQMLDDMLAEGLSRGIDVLMDQVEFTLLTEQLGSDFLPLPTQPVTVGPTMAAEKVINLVRSHLDLLRESTEKSLFDVFQQEVGVRLYASLSKHIKRQIISVDGAINLISDVNAYYMFILTLHQKNLLPYYETLKQISQLYLIDKKDAKQLGYAISDSSRYNGLVGTEDIVEFVKRRQDWPVIKQKVEKVLYGILGCIIC